jgi:hypothetical protein
VLTSYGATGTCDTQSTPTCVYVSTVTDCTLIGKTCSAGACIDRVASVRTQAPATITDIVNTSQTVYGRIFIQGVTDVTSGNDALEFLDLVEFGIGAGVDPTLYTYSVAVPNPSYGGDEATYDEYMSTFTIAGAPGAVLHYAYRLSLDGGNTWTYGDLGTAGSTDGFTTPGTLNVAAPFFSEYVEGTGSTKALEIYNPGSVAFTLTGCAVKQFTNGANTATTDITFTAATIAPGAVYTFCQSSISSVACDSTTTSTGIWNGDDAIELVCGTTVYDIIGVIGTDPGSGWGTEPTTTIDHTLLRHCDVTAGDTNGADAFDPATEWQAYPPNTLSDLGKRTCPLPP